MSPEIKIDKDMRVKAKRYLQDIAHADEHIRRLQLEIERLEQAASGCGAMRYDKERVQSSPQNTTEDNIIKLAEARDKLMETSNRLALQRAEGFNIISQLEADQYELIRDIYFDKKTFNTVCRLRYKSKRTAQRIHTKALINIGTILTQEQQNKE